MAPHEELFGLAEKLERAACEGEADDVLELVDAIEVAAREIGKAFSGSWQGYQAGVYYSDFAPPPRGAYFSQEWGLLDAEGRGSRGDWRWYDADEVEARILARAGQPNLEKARAAAERTRATFELLKSDMISLLLTELDERDDSFIAKLKEELETLKPVSILDVASQLSPKGQVTMRDTIAAGQGWHVPAHMALVAEMIAIRHAIGMCRVAGKIARRAASHLERKARRTKTADRIGTNVFMGHGRSSAWRELKDFIQDRLKLPWDEFNRVPVAGVTNIARLSEMLDAAAIALLVMTAEDEMADGALQARMNVVHEAGLFQGRLGFTKAVVLLEDGCESFSNIEGLGQIRFPCGNIAAAFEEVRRVLEREGLVSGS